MFSLLSLRDVQEDDRLYLLLTIGYTSEPKCKRQVNGVTIFTLYCQHLLRGIIIKIFIWATTTLNVPLEGICPVYSCKFMNTFSDWGYFMWLHSFLFPYIPHKPMTMCNHQADHFMCGLMSDLVICKYRKEYGHVWHRISFLRPCVNENTLS